MGSTNKQIKKLRETKRKDTEFLKGFESGRVFGFDMATIAIGRIMKRKKWSSERKQQYFEEFLAILREAEKEYADIFITDSKDDEDLWYTGKKMDDEIKYHVGEKLFCPFDKRYERK